jgi:putative ABC transport system permease protein
MGGAVSDRATDPATDSVTRAAWLLDRLARSDHGDAFAGDLLERYADRLARGDRRWRVRLWLIGEVIAGSAILLRGRRTPHPIPTPRGDGPMTNLLADLRHAARLLRRSPAFTIVATLTLALAIGGTTTIFSIVDTVLLRPPPYASPERLAMIWERDADGAQTTIGWPTFDDFARQSQSLEGAAAISGWGPMLTGPDGSEQVSGQRVSAGYFTLLGVRPMLGRSFAPEEDRPGAPRVAVLGYGLWQRRFGGDSSVVGRTIQLTETPYTVIGVLPPTFESLLNPRTEIWRPLAYDASLSYACRTCRHLRMIGRVRAGVTMTAAHAELDRLSARIVAAHPTEYPAAGTFLVPLQQEVTKGARPVLLAVTGAMALVLLIAIANVANLQLARAIRREEEFAIRTALGAGGGRLAAQLFAEGLLLAVIGGIAGVLVAVIALPSLVASLPSSLPRAAKVTLDVSALGVAAAVTLLVAIMAGLSPLWQRRRDHLAGVLRSSARLTSGRAQRRARGVLVTSEVALALMLLSGAGLLARSLVELLSVDAGFDPRGVLTFDVTAAGARYNTDAAVWAVHDRLREAVRSLPGVTGVGIASQIPLSGNMDTYTVLAQDKPLANPELAPPGDRYTVSWDFPTTLGVPIERGRAFTAADDAEKAPRVAIVSAALAMKLWGTEDAVGKRIQMGGPETPWREVVGVAGNVRHHGLEDAVTSQFYVPERQWGWSESGVTLLVRTKGDAAALAPLVRRAILSTDPAFAISRVATMEQLVSETTAQRRLALTLFGAFGAVALLLACAGIYGVLASSVTERTRELAVRSALGAAPRDIIRLIARHGAVLAGPGLVIGMAGALGLSRYLRSLLYGIGPTDPATLGGVVLVLGAIALLACVIPARRAARVDVNIALREE